MLDLVIIGGGPTGINIGIEAQKQGLNYLILEKGVLVNSIYQFPTNMTFFSTSLKLEIQKTAFISHTDKPTRKEALEYYRRLAETYEIKANLYEPVENMQRKDGFYTIKTSKSSYDTKSVAIATGFYDTPRLLDIPGENLPKVKHFYDDPHPYIGQNVLVIGSRNSACDVALETWQKGANVTMAIRSNQIYDGVKYWIKPNIDNRIKEGSIKAHFETTVKSIQAQSVTLNTPDGELTIDNDFVLAMTGYKPNYPFLERLGLEISDDELAIPLYNEATLETTLPNVYVAGVVAAGLQTSKFFIENTRHHGEVIVNDIISKNK